MWAIVPLKSPDAAKSRLRGVLDDALRRRLFLAMARHALRTLVDTPGIAKVLVVTSSDEVERLARGIGAEVLRQPLEAGTSEACVQAVGELCGVARSVLIVSGDLPLLSQAALAPFVVLAQQDRAVAIAADRHRRGTNVLMCRPPDAIPLSFGVDSFRAHVEHASRRGLALHVVESPLLGLDIDTPEDLDALVRHPAVATVNAELREILDQVAEMQP